MPAPHWIDHGDRLSRSLRFQSFAQAIAFMVEISVYCDKADHHPDWRNVYDRLDITLTTHDAGGVTEKDIALALHINAVFARFAAQ